MGLVLVKAFSDSLTYFRKDQKNHLEIIKTVRSKASLNNKITFVITDTTFHFTFK